jgi:hypothetical protein
VGGFHFAVKIHLERKGSGIEDGATILAKTQMALDFGSHLRR